MLAEWPQSRNRNGRLEHDVELKSSIVDAINTALAAAGFNLRWLMSTGAPDIFVGEYFSTR
jgi:hypothetical protein